MTAKIYPPVVREFALAIARAEGFFVHGSVPQRANNPGDIKVAHWTGPTLGAEHIPVFPTLNEGWDALYHQIDLIRRGKSHVYTCAMTIAEMGRKWTDTESDAWALNVAAALGVTPDATLNMVLS